MLSKRGVVSWVIVSCEEDGEGVKDFMLLATKILGVLVDELQCLCDCIVCILASETSAYEVILHVHYYKCCILHSY